MSITVRSLTPSQTLLRTFNQSSQADDHHVMRVLQEATDQGRSIVIIHDHTLRSRDTPLAHLIEINSQEIRSIDLALMITQLIISEAFDLVVLKGCGDMVVKYLPRLRWIVSQYQVDLILLGDYEGQSLSQS